MRREIKFRAWSTEYNRFLDCECSQFRNYIHGYANPVERNQGWKTITVQQYTGMNDKNGREIYEGDILYINSSQYPEITPYTVKIEWSDIKCGWNITPIGYFEVEVIGNIFENPELVK